MIKRKITAEVAEISKKKGSREREKKNKTECPGGIEPALGGTYTKGAGPLLTGHSTTER